MNPAVYSAIVALAEEPSMKEKTLSYLTEHLRGIVEPGEGVLICSLRKNGSPLSKLMEEAVVRCGGIPILWGEDRRWRTLLRLAFTSRATTIIGSPLVILGLSKLKKANAIPLYIQNVVIAGYPCFNWMLDGIDTGFDCKSWMCFSLGDSSVVAGFSCDHSRGVHLRRDAYDLEIRDDKGRLLPDGQDGRWVLSPKDHPELRYGSGDFGRLEYSPCTCGDPSPRIVDLRPVDVEDGELAELSQYLLSWTSVLDCSVRRGPWGLEIELITFPGEKLPKLPTCAKQTVRPWDPEVDEPIPFVPGRKKHWTFEESH